MGKAGRIGKVEKVRGMERVGGIREHQELGIYQLAFQSAMKIFEVSRCFPVEERYSLTDQMRRSSCSVCANLAEAWRKRRYQAAFVAKLSDCEAEATETQTWLEFAIQCNYMDPETGHQLLQTYNQILSGLVKLIQNPTPWLLP